MTVPGRVFSKNDDKNYLLRDNGSTSTKFVTSQSPGNFDQLICVGHQLPQLLETSPPHCLSTWWRLNVGLIVWLRQLNKPILSGMFSPHQYQSGLSRDLFVIYIICFIQSISAEIFVKTRNIFSLSEIFPSGVVIMLGQIESLVNKIPVHHKSTRRWLGVWWLYSHLITINVWTVKT